ncbi:MAG TPA: PucR family transcriptional regulator ligand-binding domain-containing protein, partial [Candidatus Limnocylindrales bacterium]|nr:PucR family transcriptional regulator ligand-binding domain-containing protein [Candidatus Limnocylindrales bacterium]
MHRPLDEPPVPSAPARVPRRAWTGLATVRDLLAVEPLRLSLVAGARGIDRPIRWAHAIELPDPRPYLRGHELVLTMGAWLVDRAACERFVGYLLERDASGIGFGVGNYHPHAPDGLRAACDAADLALVEVPFEVPFVAITEELAERLARQRTERDRRALRREALLLDALGEGRGLAGIAAILARELGGAVAVLGPDGTLEAVEAAGGGAGRGGGRVTGGRVLRTHGDARSPTGLTGDSPVPLATMLARALRGRRPDARRIAHTEDGRAVELSVIRHGGRPI